MDKKETIKEFSYVGIGRTATIVLQALFYLILAAFIEPEFFGELNVIIALASTFSIISLFGLNLSLQVFQAKNNSQVSEGIITLFIITTTAASLILVVINQSAALLCVSLSFFMMAQSHLMGLKQYKKFMIFSILKSGIFFAVPLILYFPFGIEGIIFGMALSNFIGSISFYKHLKVRALCGLRDYSKVLIHNFGVTSGFFLPNSIDKLMIAPLLGIFIVGVYQFNLQVLTALCVLPGVLSQYLTSEESSGEGHRKLSLLAVLASVILAIISIVLAPSLVPIFYPKYSNGIESLQIMVLAIIPNVLGAIYYSKLLAKESTRIGYSAIVQIGNLLLLIALLGNLYGLVGLALAVLISQIANTLFLYYLYRNSIQCK
jgi:O-antigen/teichoic acid export membrane protein